MTINFLSIAPVTSTTSAAPSVSTVSTAPKVSYPVASNAQGIVFTKEHIRIGERIAKWILDEEDNDPDSFNDGILDNNNKQFPSFEDWKRVCLFHCLYLTRIDFV